jgi:hypothetical protein
MKPHLKREKMKNANTQIQYGTNATKNKKEKKKTIEGGKTAFGALIPEVLDILRAFHFVGPVWWSVGYSKLKVILCKFNFRHKSHKANVS